MKNSPIFRLLRINHWFKNLFLLFGFLAGLWYVGSEVLPVDIFIKAILALLLASLVSSGNYIINQITDSKFDKKHPTKRKRPIPSGKVSEKLALIIALALFMTSLWISVQLYSVNFTITLLAFWSAGLAYNVRPIRLKDIPFIDVIAESINNPIRLLLGWFVVVPFVLPPTSIMLLTWVGGAILMSAKRYDELKVHGKELVPYRLTFKTYSLENIKLLINFYTILTLILIVFVAWSYQKILLIAWPPTVLLTYWVLKEVFSGKAEARYPEKFVLSEKFVIFSLALLAIYLFLAFLG